jgi:hypothetical protein
LGAERIDNTETVSLGKNNSKKNFVALGHAFSN